MFYNIDLEKLTDDQLEAFRVIDENAYKTEKENRSTYSEEDMRNFQIYTDLDKAYYYLKPMYDNMRNTEVKKTITESGILATLEKVFRWTKKKNVNFKRYEPIVETTQPVLPTNEVPQSDMTHHYQTEVTNEPTTEEIPVPAPELMPEPIPQPEPQATVVEDKVVIPATQSTLETMSTEELNKIMASIPAVEKI